MSQWNIENAKNTYSLAYWGGGYVEINAAGQVEVLPRREQGARINLYKLAEDLTRAELNYPVLVRFTDILRDRVDSLCDAFATAMQASEYQGRYTAVYPIKVNQQHSVVEEIYRHGSGRVGLEAGSKPELMAVLGTIETKGDVIVCNGYKDREYIRLALIGLQLGYRVFIVVEKPSELQMVYEEAQKLGVKPLLGVRMRLASIGAGKWQNTGGEKSKFGLSASQLLQVMERLTQWDLRESLQMLHFHLGSQIANIHDIQRGMRECARYYAEVRSLGFEIQTVDVGGGLGVDYEGTRSRSFCSINYSVQEYANNVVHALWEICQEQQLPHPNIITESGRAMTAHHAVLITNVIDIGKVPQGEAVAEPEADDPMILHTLWYSFTTLREKPEARAVAEVYHDVLHGLSEAQAMYNHGVLSLQQRARAEEIYFAVCQKIHTILQQSPRANHEILEELKEKLADKYFCNFSLFQSLPDIWAIDQIFPIIPLHRLDEEPTRRGVLEDITCDSDGRIDHYVDSEGIESSLPLHEYKPGETYLLGMFLIGAYQEILGDMHNLFGDTDSVHVALDGKGGYRISEVVRGDTVDHVLNYVRYNSSDLLKRYQAKIVSSTLSREQQASYLQAMEDGLHGYTYLED